MSNFVYIEQPEMEKVVLPLGFQPMKLEGTVELVYGKIVRYKNIPLSLRLYSSLNPNGVSRDLGEDAIRLILYWKNPSKENQIQKVGKIRRLYRVENWRQNLTNALDNWQENIVFCPKCNSPMVQRKSKNGKFYGCSCYPQCKGTLNG